MLGLLDRIKLGFSTLQSEELRGDFRNKWEKIRIWMVTRIFQSLPGGPERRSKHLEQGEREHTRHRRNGIQPGRKNPPRTAPKQQEKYRKGGKPCCSLWRAGAALYDTETSHKNSICGAAA